ncbi:MAG: helix-hairpin-helix domain-containing protein, partial [Candidatus Jordarchaeales archaeon]
EEREATAKEKEESKEAIKEAPSEAISVERTPLTVLKGLGPKTEAKLKEVGVESVEELAEEDAEVLSEATGISVQKLSSWISEAKLLLKEKKGK